MVVLFACSVIVKILMVTGALQYQARGISMHIGSQWFAIPRHVAGHNLSDATPSSDIPFLICIFH